MVNAVFDREVMHIILTVTVTLLQCLTESIHGLIPLQICGHNAAVFLLEHTLIAGDY